MRLVRSALVVVSIPTFVLALFGGGAPSVLACPASDLEIPGAMPVSIAAADGDLMEVRDGAVYARAAFDLVDGRLAMVHPGSLSHSVVRARDAFTVTGFAAGTPLPVRVQFAVEGAISTVGCGGSGCWGTVEAEIRAGDLVEERIVSMNLYAPERRPFVVVFELPLTLVAGQPTEIEFRLEGWRSPGASHSSEGAGTYRFLDLPAGAGIASCNGFTGLPTPVRAATWGGVKAHYR